MAAVRVSDRNHNHVCTEGCWEEGEGGKGREGWGTVLLLLRRRNRGGGGRRRGLLMLGGLRGVLVVVMGG